jgi:PAS domain S-box-containing protein
VYLVIDALQDPFPILRIDASSGGPEALARLVAQLPRDAGMAYLLLQHFDPGIPEQDLAALLAKATPMPVIDAIDGMKVLRDRIYVVAPNASMTMVRGYLSIAPPDTSTVNADDMRQTRIELHEKTTLLERQSKLLELSQDAVIVRNAGNRVISWNRGAQAMYGYTAAEALGQPLERLLLTDTSQWMALNDELDRFGEWEGELRQFRRDGTPMLVHSREVLVRNPDGSRSAVLAIKRDISELRHAMEALTEADRRKDEFMATLAHELRNPLAPVRNAVEIMRIAGNNPETMTQVRNMLDRQVQQLSRIVDDLIDVSRIVEKKIELRRERIAVTRVVDLALETCRSRIAGRQQALSVTLPSEPLMLDADPARISQVLINLLDNASKYSDTGGHIWLSVEQYRNGGGPVSEVTVIIRVRDDGIGIAADVLPTVFDMFTQGARTREQGRGGLGVGLALVRSLVEMHQGQIQVESEGPGHGSEFTVRLPASGGESLARAASVAPKANATPVKVRLVVVDDSADHAESLGMLLQLMGHEVFLAASGPEALAAVERFQPDAALIDIGLPGMTGYEVARRIRMRPEFRDMLLVAQTGWGQTEDRVRSKEAGFDHHLVKPVNREALEAILNSVSRLGP